MEATSLSPRIVVSGYTKWSASVLQPALQQVSNNLFFLGGCGGFKFVSLEYIKKSNVAFIPVVKASSLVKLIG
jgi:hypothetical protein